MKKVRIGVMGVYRGTSMLNYCRQADNAQIVAMCDKWVEGLETQKQIYGDDNIAYYTDFDEFIKHDMDAVVLANYANEHAPFAIKALRAGKHVFSEVLPVETMAQAVELIETIEETGLVYAYGENYCYMPAAYEMKKLYKKGVLGEFEYGECEYVHNCEPIWPSISYGDKNHWRNNMYSTFYCTHSIGPIVHITGLRPVKVTGFESPMNTRNLRIGAKGGAFGIEMLELENGGIVKSIHGGLYRNSIWYSIYGSKGRMESAREDAMAGGMEKIYVNCDEYDGQYGNDTLKAYEAKPFEQDGANFGHGGSDYHSMYNFIEKILGAKDADSIDIYEALDMFLPGMFAYRSILAGGIPMDIPNLRNKEEREKYRNDTTCATPAVAGDMLVPTCKSGTPDIPDEVYEKMYRLWREEYEKQDGYTAAAFNQGKKKDK